MVHSFREGYIKGMRFDKSIILTVLSSLWVETNYQKLEQICKRVSREEPYDDLCQTCIEQFLNNKKVHTVPEGEKLYFFAKIVTNNFNSKSSPYFKQYKKFKFSEIDNIELVDKEYEEDPIDIKWALNELMELGWYYKRLMELFIEEDGSISKLSRRTTIPINSVSRDINFARKFLRKKRNEIRNNHGL